MPTIIDNTFAAFRLCFVEWRVAQNSARTVPHNLGSRLTQAALGQRRTQGVPERKPRASRAPSETDLRVGTRLREARHARGMTLEDLAGRIGMSHQQLQKYERGTNRISAGTLFDIAVLLDVPIARFYESEAPSPEDQDLRLRRAAHRIVDAVSEPDLVIVVRVLRALLE